MGSECSAAAETGLRLEIAGEETRLTEHAAINARLKDVGAKVWPLSLANMPDDARSLLDRANLSESEQAKLVDQFLLPRARLLEIIAAAGRAPHVADGGAMRTQVSGHEYGYPRLYLVEDGVDYSRFDRFHVNRADDGTGADEIMQILSGGTIVLHQQMPDGEVSTLHLDCPSATAGWLLTYDGGRPHIGSLSGADAGTKVLMQIIGPPVWAIRYTDDS